MSHEAVELCISVAANLDGNPAWSPKWADELRALARTIEQHGHCDGCHRVVVRHASGQDIVRRPDPECTGFILQSLPMEGR